MLSMKHEILNGDTLVQTTLPAALNVAGAETWVFQEN